MKSPTVQRIMYRMEKYPWHTKLRVWFMVKVWTYTFLTRKYWDKSYIFKKKKDMKKTYIAKFRGIEIPVSIPMDADAKMILANIDFHGEEYYKKMREYGIIFSVPELNEFFEEYFNHERQTNNNH